VIDTKAPRLGEAQPPAGGAGRAGGLGVAWWQGGQRILSRAPWLACCLLLAVLPFVTAPGKIIADTKFELVVNPASFLSGALTLWNPQQFGGLLNQTVGYLFPMGTFFEFGKLLAVDGWITQRLWIGLVLIAAFGGTVKLAGRIGIGTPWTRAAAGLAYALSPAALSILGQMSGEFLPMAMLPWIIIPLADPRLWDQTPPAQKPSRVRAVARSAVAIALCSGMNAASTVAVVVPAVIYILTRPAMRTRMLALWAPAVVLVTLSWSIPLVLLSKYGVPVVTYTESAQVTSSSTSLLNVFRGTENWVNYLVVNGQSWRPLALQIATDVVPAILVGLLAALGLAGLVRRDLPERRFLLWSALLGVLVVSLGYVSSLGSPLEGPIISLVNGPASPFRNLWKFDPMIRLPLAFGLAHLLAAARLPWLRAALITAAATAFGGLAVPAFATGLASAGSFSQVPSYWVTAADWITAHAGTQAVLVEPGSPFGQYIWGSPMDDVLQALTNADYAERNLSVVGSAGNERLINTVDQRLAAGAGSAGLTQTLARMGVKYVLVRNDLNRSVLNGAWPARISDALAASPGIKPVAQFGPTASGLGADDAATDFDAPYPAVQIYQVTGVQPTVTVQPAANTMRVYGAPESLITLADEGLLGNRPVLINDDGAGQPTAASVATDSLRRRVVNFGQLRTNYSPTLTATEPADTFLATQDYTRPGWSKYQAVAQYAGIKGVTASSSSAGISALSSQWASGTMPYSAVDNTLATMWESGSWTGPIGQWIQVDFTKSVPFGGSGGSSPRASTAGTIRVAFADNASIGPPVTQVTISTAAGKVSDPVQVTGNLQSLRIPAGASGWLRITITGLQYPPDTALGPQAGIAGILVPGVSASRTIVAPSVPGGDPSAIVLAKAQPQPSGCMLTSLRWVCSPTLSTTTEEQYGFDHSFKIPYSERAVVRGSVILTNPSLADRYARFGLREAAATASSTYTDDLADQPRNAFDGNPATAWIASPDDAHPSLTIRWDAARQVSRVTIRRPPGASGPLQVLITGSKGQVRGAIIGADGVVKFAPMTTTSLTFTFSPVQSPLQITDVVIPGVPFIAAPSGQFQLPCGFGPLLQINAKAVPTKVSGTVADLLNGRPMEFTACSDATLPAGTNRVTESPVDAFAIQDVVLDAAGPAGLSTAASAAGPAPVAATVQSWTSSVRKLRIAASTRSYLVVNENFNPGWRAVIAGRRLQAVQLDGWKQAWVVPAGTAGVVTLTYQPESLYRDAVVGGLAILALIMLVAAGLKLPRRRRGQLAEAPQEQAEQQPQQSSEQKSQQPRQLQQPQQPQEPQEPGKPQQPGKPQEPGKPQPSGPRPSRRSRLAHVLVCDWMGYVVIRARRYLFRWLGIAIVTALLAGAGLMLGGYPGAILVPFSALIFSIPARGWRVVSSPWVLGGLLFAASACGAVGEHLALSGDIGLVVSAPANAIPQVICLIVVGGLAAALLRPAAEPNRDRQQN
jgi:arabinofuranan 3-O-arabinosyltransferase